MPEIPQTPLNDALVCAAILTVLFLVLDLYARHPVWLAIGAVWVLLIYLLTGGWWR